MHGINSLQIDARGGPSVLSLSAMGSLPQGGGGWQWGYEGTDVAT